MTLTEDEAKAIAQQIKEEYAGGIYVKQVGEYLIKNGHENTSDNQMILHRAILEAYND